MHSTKKSKTSNKYLIKGANFKIDRTRAKNELRRNKNSL